MSKTNYFSLCTTWNLVDIDKSDPSSIKYVWRCSFCEHLHTTDRNKNGWLFCPMCGFKISTSTASSPVDRIFNTLNYVKANVPLIVVDWARTESTVYICHDCEIKPNKTFRFKGEERKIERCLEHLAFKPPRGLAAFVEFKIIHIDSLPDVPDKSFKRFKFLNPLTNPRYEDEIPERG